MLLNKVDVPEYFAQPAPIRQNNTQKAAKKATPKTYVPNGWILASDPPKIPYKNAAKICEAKGNAEGRAYLSGYSSKNTSTNCYGYGYNSFSCRTQGSGGFWGGMKEAQDKRSWRSAAKELAESVAIGCMAQYGWIRD